MPKPSAAAQFAELGIPATDYTKAMKTAIAQKWSGLPVETKIGDLRDQLAAVATAPVPSVDTILAEFTAADPAATREQAVSEQGRLTRNAKVNAWRARGQLQAAIDARDLKFKALRARKGTSAGAVRSTSGDAPVLEGAAS